VDAGGSWHLRVSVSKFPRRACVRVCQRTGVAPLCPSTSCVEDWWSVDRTASVSVSAEWIASLPASFLVHHIIHPLRSSPRTGFSTLLCYPYTFQHVDPSPERRNQGYRGLLSSKSESLSVSDGVRPDRKARLSAGTRCAHHVVRDEGASC